MEKMITEELKITSPSFPPDMDSLFKYLNFEDLKKCRLVCHDWNRKSLLQFRTNSKIPVIQMTLTDETRIEQFCRSSDLMDFKSFNFKFKYTIASMTKLVQFLEGQGQGQIDNVTFIVGKCEPKIVVMDELLSFLATYSNMWKSFSLEFKHDSCVHETINLFDLWSVNWSQLSDLWIYAIDRHSVFLSILNAATSLRKLVVTYGCHDPYLPLLAKFESTLTYLELSNLSESNDLPSLFELKTLKQNDSNEIGRLTNKYYPELTDLKFSSIHSPFFHTDFICSKVLSLEFWTYKLEESYFQKLIISFPNLKKLTLSACENLELVKIWKHIKTIEGLSILSENLTDNNLMGFYPDRNFYDHLFQLLDLDKTQPRVQKNWTQWNATDIRHWEKSHHILSKSCIGISTLLGLKSFTVASYRISNFGFICRILRCKGIRSLNIKLPSRFMTKDILRLIADEMELLNLSLSVSTETHHWSTSEEAEYFRGKHPYCQLIFNYYPSYDYLISPAP